MDGNGIGTDMRHNRMDTVLQDDTIAFSTLRLRGLKLSIAWRRGHMGEMGEMGIYRRE